MAKKEKTQKLKHRPIDSGNGNAVSKCDTETEVSEFAQDVVKKLEPLELERFCRYEAEIRTCVQGMRIVDLELLEIKRTLAAKANEAMQQKQLFETTLNTKWKIGYDRFLKELADKYGITEPAHMLIDPDAGTIRDSSES